MAAEQHSYSCRLSHDTFGDSQPTPTFVMRKHWHSFILVQRIVPYVSST
jgi:hypothetical protein